MIIIIADDLTGATDTGVQFQKRGIATSVIVNGLHSVCRAEYPAISINVDSRVLNGRDAYQRTFDVLKKMPIKKLDLIYKKVDSLMRGNPAEELDAVIQASGRNVTLLAPSFPSMGRIVRDGVLHMPDGTQKDLLEEFRRRSQFPITPISLKQLYQSYDMIQSHLASVQQPHVFLIDAEAECDLQKVASIGHMLQPIYCGSAGLAEKLQLPQQPVLKMQAGTGDFLGKILIVTGSRKRETAEQILRIKEVCQMEEIIMQTESVPIQAEITNVAALLSQKLLKSANGAILALDSLFKSQTDFQDESPNVKARAHLLAEALGKVVKLVSPELYAGIILVGGDTAFNVCRFLEVKQINLLSEIQPGMPFGIFADGIVRNKSIVTKSGAFGDPNALVSAWFALKSSCASISANNLSLNRKSTDPC